MKGQLAFGGASLSGKGGGYGFGTIADPIELVQFAYESGITCFDTAPIYGFGESETVLGKSINGFREKVQIVSKSGITWHENGRVNPTNDPGVTQSMLEDSLRRLNTDYIDVYMIHWPDPRVDIRYPLEVLAKAQVEGKIKNLGLCNTNPYDLKLASEVAKIDYLQSEFNLFNDGFAELEIRDEILMGWGTLDKGILAGTVKKDRQFTKEDARSWAPWWKKSKWKEKVNFVQGLNFNVYETALNYSLRTCDLTLVGAKSINQLENCLDVIKSPITEEQLNERYERFKSFS